MSEKQTVKKDPSEMPSVKAFMDVKDKWANLRKEYPGIFEEIDALATEYNTLLEAADKDVRSAEVACGPFDLYQYRTNYDATAFYDAVGREKFLELGGSTQTVQQLDIDKKTFEANAAQGKISKAVVSKVKEVSPSYHAPKKIVLP